MVEGTGLAQGVYLAECIDEIVLENQLPHKTDKL